MRACLASFLVMSLAGCTILEHNQTAAAPKEAAIVVDNRIELMSVIQLLSDYFLTSSLETSYKTRARAHFAPCVNHPAVTKFVELSANGFNFSNVPDAFVALSNAPDLKGRFRVKAEVIESAGGIQNYNDFFTKVRAFAVDCKFDEFFDANQAYYNQLVDHTQPSAAAAIQSLETYLGQSLGSSTVILGPLLHDGGFATFYTGDGSDTFAFAFIGPSEAKHGLPSFGAKPRLQPLVAHEFAHTVINPLTTRFSEDVADLQSNFVSHAEAMKLQGYISWEQLINESIIRAITARLTALERGEEVAREEIDKEVRRGFVYVPGLVQSLQKYEEMRASYANIGDYYPYLLEVFKKNISAAVTEE